MASFFKLFLDTTAPAGVTLSLNDDARYTTSASITAKIGCEDAETTGYQMKIWGSVDGAATEADAAWVTFAATKEITLTTGDGKKTVNLKVRDDVGNESAVVTKEIILDTVVPVVTITGPDKSKISKVETFNVAAISFTCDVDFVEYKVKVVPTTASLQDAGVVIGTTNGSTNMSGTGEYPDAQAIDCTINAADLEAASAGDGEKIIKVFVRNAAGTWSVA
jgi:hypothetical protein